MNFLVNSQTNAASPGRQHLLCDSPVILSRVEIKPSRSVSVLGVAIDSGLSMETQVGRTVSSAWYHIKQLWTVARCLPADALKTLVSAFVVSRLDYCNVVYAGLPQVQLRRLQLAFNGAARLIYGENRRCSISPLLKSLHWLRVEERITYKLCLTVYKALNGKAPACISELCTLDLEERRALRSRAHSANKLVEPNRANKSNFFERAFSVAGPVTWNRLPLNVRQNQTESSFRNALKTALFPRSHPRP